MPPSKKRNKNGTWSPIYGPAWVHPKTRAAADRADKAEALLRDIAAELREDGYVVIPARIDALLEGKA